MSILQDIPSDEIFEETKNYTLKVLLVDDNFFNVDVLAQIIQFNCPIVSHIYKSFSGKEALENLSLLFKECTRNEDLQTIDFAFLDINMPEMSGFELARKLRHIYSQNSQFKTPIICAVTAQENVMQYEEWKENLFDHLILKPVSPDQISDFIYSSI